MKANTKHDFEKNQIRLRYLDSRTNTQAHRNRAHASCTTMNWPLIYWRVMEKLLTMTPKTMCYSRVNALATARGHHHSSAIVFRKSVTNPNEEPKMKRNRKERKIRCADMCLCLVREWIIKGRCLRSRSSIQFYDELSLLKSLHRNELKRSALDRAKCVRACTPVWVIRIHEIMMNRSIFSGTANAWISVTSHCAHWV